MEKIVFNIRKHNGEIASREGYLFSIKGLRLVTSKNAKYWDVTELQSGALFCGGSKTRKECVQYAKDRLAKYDLAKCNEIIACFVKEHGEANSVPKA